MQPKRGRYEICRDILNVARHTAGITAIVYGANLNFPIANKNIKEMMVNGLMTMEDHPGGGSRTKLYQTTERGLAFIKSLEEALAIFRGLTFPSVIVHKIPIQEMSEP